MAARPAPGAAAARPGAGAAAAAAAPPQDQEDSDPSIKRLSQSISCHAWNGDRTKLAVSPNNSEIHIYDTSGPDWTLEHVLKEHDQLVTGLDWGAQNNRIVSCSQDRNAYVWRFDAGAWKPTLVILRLNRAATFVKWSPNEDKFAVASGAKLISICYFEADHDWWVSKHLKKHTSTILRIDWHPNNVLIATASTDKTCRVFSAFIKGVDKRPGETPFGNRLPFGEELAVYEGDSFVHGVKWSPSASQLAFVTHSASVTFIDLTGGAPGEFQVIRLKDLPTLDLIWINENAVVIVGHSCFPRLVEKTAEGWVAGRNLDENKQGGEKKMAGTRAAFQMFQNKVEKGEESSSATILKTKHQGTINTIRPFKGTAASLSELTTSGFDGKVVFWTL